MIYYNIEQIKSLCKSSNAIKLILSIRYMYLHCDSPEVGLKQRAQQTEKRNR